MNNIIEQIINYIKELSNEGLTTEEIIKRLEVLENE